MSESTDELSNAEATENEVQESVVSEENSGTGIDQDLIQSIPVTVTAELGSAKLKLKDLLRLTQGSVLELDTVAGSSLNLKVNGAVIAKGEVVTVGDHLGLSVTDCVAYGADKTGLIVNQFDPIYALIVFIVLIFSFLLLAWFIRNKTSLVSLAVGESNIKLSSTFRLDSKNKLCVVEYRKKRLLLGVGPNSLNLLDCENLEDTEVMTREESEKQGSFRNVLGNALKQKDS